MVYLKKLSKADGIDVFEMLKGIKQSENSFKNPTYSMSFTEFQNWLIEQENWEKGLQLPNDYVPQTIFWLYEDTIPIGIGKIRHSLTEKNRINGGNIGYAISQDYRGKGYGRVLLKLLLDEARKINVREILLTVDKNNIASRKVCEFNKGEMIDENDERYYFKF